LIRFVLLATLLVSGNLAAQTLCTLGDLQRVISVEYESSQAQVPCRVRYKKVTEDEITYPWRAEREAGYCEARADALSAKFSSLGWSCKAKPESSTLDATENSASNP
jgi:hypothetical protein|tara:strand:+ start:27 stop:347 length:321 start_codon:yes stop_codon:yes gene_type:complete